MSETVKSTMPEPTMAWLLVAELPKDTCGLRFPNGWACLHTREVIGYLRQKDGSTIFEYSDWKAVPVFLGPGIAPPVDQAVST